jgi:hypothetical protein
MNMLDDGRDLHLKIVDAELCAVMEKKKPRPEDARREIFVGFPASKAFHGISPHLSFCIVDANHLPGFDGCENKAGALLIIFPPTQTLQHSLRSCVSELIKKSS